MSWIEASLVSALFLGVHDLCIKHAIRGNAVLPVLFRSTLTGATVWTVLLLVQAIDSGLLPAALVTGRLAPIQQRQLLLKSAIVTASWIFTYFGLKYLPLSLAPPHPRNFAVVDTGGGAVDSGRASNGNAIPGRHYDPGIVRGAFPCRSVGGSTFSSEPAGMVSDYGHGIRWSEFTL